MESNNDYSGELLERNVVWPPKVNHVTALGHIRDIDGNCYQRDGGVSTELSNGTIVFQFGDTFCYNYEGEFTGFSSNTVALGSKHFPVLTSYKFQNTEEDTTDDDLKYLEKRIPNFVRRFMDEMYNSFTTFKIWSHSGIVEIDNDNENIHGWTYFEMLGDEYPDGRQSVYCWTGIAKVVASNASPPATIISTRQYNGTYHRKLFQGAEPHCGAFCALAHEGFVYAYGHISHTGFGYANIVLARVPCHDADKRSEYRFWNGHTWVSDWESSIPILDNMQHGKIFKTNMFGRGSEYKWAFIGCNSWRDSKIRFGRATRPEGPWSVRKLDVQTYSLHRKGTLFTYCMYPHPWAYDSDNGDLMVSWSEGGLNAGVVAVLVRLRTTIEKVPDHCKSQDNNSAAMDEQRDIDNDIVPAVSSLNSENDGVTEAATGAQGSLAIGSDSALSSPPSDFESWNVTF